MRIQQTMIQMKPELVLMTHMSDKGLIEIEQIESSFPYVVSGRKAFMSGKPAPDGKYKLDFMWYAHIKDGQVLKLTIF